MLSNNQGRGANDLRLGCRLSHNVLRSSRPPSIIQTVSRRKRHVASSGLLPKWSSELRWVSTRDHLTSSLLDIFSNRRRRVLILLSNSAGFSDSYSRLRDTFVLLSICPFDMSQNPQFLDAGSGNYRLASSPCIDMGEDNGAPNHDRDGGSRPYPNHPWSRDTDVGAYEYGCSTGALSAYVPDGTVVEIPGLLVSAMFPQWGRIYVQRMDRVSGIRVDTSNTYTIGHQLTIRGTLQTDATLAERYIVPSPACARSAGRSGL